MKALIAMSGGVDSSVAAYLMKKRGYECIGATMRLFDNETAGIDGESTCCSLSDVEDARMVAASLDMPFYVFNFTGDFRACVIDDFIEEYAIGHTPNPCIRCNRYLKFEKLFERADMLGCERIVTGHYACIERDEESGRYLMKKAKDPGKDQTYVLYNLSQGQLKRVCFPLADYRKEEIRAIASENNFLNAEKHDSQDICFVPDGNYAAVIERFSGKTFERGPFVGPDGEILGEHKGIIHYTIGQRRGLGLSLKEPLYVKKLDLINNAVILGRNEELFTRELTAGAVNWIMYDENALPEVIEAGVKVRYSQRESRARIHTLGKNQVKVIFEEPVRAVTPGQSAVFYSGDYVIGGGIIEGGIIEG